MVDITSARAMVAAAGVLVGVVACGHDIYVHTVQDFLMKSGFPVEVEISYIDWTSLMI